MLATLKNTYLDTCQVTNSDNSITTAGTGRLGPALITGHIHQILVIAVVQVQAQLLVGHVGVQGRNFLLGKPRLQEAKFLCNPFHRVQIFVDPDRTKKEQAM